MACTAGQGSLGRVHQGRVGQEGVHREDNPGPGPSSGSPGITRIALLARIAIIAILRRMTTFITFVRNSGSGPPPGSPGKPESDGKTRKSDEESIKPSKSSAFRADFA